MPSNEKPPPLTIDITGGGIQTGESVQGEGPNEIIHELIWPVKTSNTVIIQSFVPYEGKPYDEALEWLKPIHGAYCQKWGYDYLASSEKVVESNNPNARPNWNRIPLMIQAIESGYEYVIWIDHDCVIVDFDKDLRDAFDEPGADVMMCVHPGFPQAGLFAHFNNGVMMVRSSEKSFKFLQEVWAKRYGGPPWYEQDIMNELLRDFTYMDVVGVMGDRYNSTPNANQVPDDQVVIAAFHGVGTYADVHTRLDYMKQFAELRKVDEQIANIDNYVDPLAK
jgi:hypothetical protein